MTVSDPAIVSGGRSIDFAELDRDPYDLRTRTPRGTSVGLRCDHATGVLAAIVALEGWASDVHLFPSDLDVAATGFGGTVIELDSAPLDDGEDTPRSPATAPTHWVVYTSGTTGVPKSIRHTLGSLTRTVSTKRVPFVWGLLYDPNRMAGLQVLLQALASHSTIVAPLFRLPLRQRLAELASGGVTALSATPTLWRQILQSPAADDLELRQITLGGEIADQAVLDALRYRYPAARIVHVFAATETGAAFSVRDGREGFPASYLNEPPKGIRLAVRDDVLFVHAPGVEATVDGWVSTGDVVEIVGDRVLFRGRGTGVVNVGGANVWPERVEAVLRQHPDVVEAAVAARPNPLVGNVLVAEVTIAPAAAVDGAGPRIRRWLRERAPSSYVPATIKVVEEIGVTAAGKVRR